MVWQQLAHRAAVALVCLALGLPACATKTIKPQGAEQSVVDVVSDQTGFRPTDVSCPSGIEAKVGVTFDCHFTGPDGPYTAHMTVTAVRGSRVDFLVDTERRG
jgi:Domain of unknown function (DUF4333)